MPPSALSFTLPPELVDALAAEVTVRVLEQLGEQAAVGRWVRGARAIAGYLDMPLSTVEKLISRGELPVTRPMGAGGPVFANTAELDRWAAA